VSARILLDCRFRSRLEGDSTTGAVWKLVVGWAVVRFELAIGIAGSCAVALTVPVYDFMADSETTVSKARPVCCNRDQFGNHCLDVRSIFEAAHRRLVRDSNDHSRVRLFGRSVPAKCAVRFASDLGRR